MIKSLKLCTAFIRDMSVLFYVFLKAIFKVARVLISHLMFCPITFDMHMPRLFGLFFWASLKAIKVLGKL